MTSQTGKTKAARYGMVVDLDRCNGCGACMLACAVENNVPPAAPGATDRTGITPLRVYRYENEGRVVFVPIMCQHCEIDTPCVAVCPQQAVELDPATGIVGQIPQRCLGCRYCMAACPYHARYFNWSDPEWPAGMERALNPAVAPRMRGVVEKCNMCHGRWHEARELAAARGESGPVAYTPACVEACPARAITFGDLNDEASLVAQMARQNEAFRWLESIGTGSKVYYRSRREWVRESSRKEVNGRG
ncbi:MAG: 4Fe-4S dicluster domain-containing protein [Bryobacteraceae bacterium]|jgi:molybdopterin-containing oxidoreductase family iron-sulfur binding subunit